MLLKFVQKGETHATIEKVYLRLYTNLCSIRIQNSCGIIKQLAHIAL